MHSLLLGYEVIGYRACRDVLSRPGRLVLLTDHVQVLAWKGEEILGTVKSEPGLDLALEVGLYAGVGLGY